MSIESIIEKASNGTLEQEEVIAFSEKGQMSLDEFAHKFSRDVAQNYWDGLYGYSFCDGAMNWLYGFLTDPTYLESNDNTISEFPLEVYLAFDAGEYHHSGDDDSVDPVRKYTDPAIEKVLNAKNS
ncbi:MAG: hypothetical protein R3F02_15120 [Thiolinea sp.]